MKAVGRFPFGHPVRIVAQEDRTPKRVFVLGVYASAVHARWVGNDSEEIVKALAIASEPEVFWRGEGAAEIVQTVSIPGELGRLEVASRRFNGPSGVALDELLLAPLGLTRDEAWLCDLVPHSCLNSGQKRAIKRAYQPLVRRFGLPEVSVPEVPHRFTDERRRGAILGEMQESQAEILIVLGDQPIKWFLRFHATHWRRLSDFGSDAESYGRMHQITIEGGPKWVLPLAHPRQVAKLGRFSKKWFWLHQSWLEERASSLLG